MVRQVEEVRLFHCCFTIGRSGSVRSLLAVGIKLTVQNGLVVSDAARRQRRYLRRVGGQRDRVENRKCQCGDVQARRNRLCIHGTMFLHTLSTVF